MKLSPNSLCPCGSTKKAKRCCGPLLDGQPAPSPEALMRSRYVAYSLGDVAYVQRTTHSHSPHRAGAQAPAQRQGHPSHGQAGV